jgi:hypothetical protein
MCLWSLTRQAIKYLCCHLRPDFNPWAKVNKATIRAIGQPPSPYGMPHWAAAPSVEPQFETTKHAQEAPHMQSCIMYPFPASLTRVHEQGDCLPPSQRNGLQYLPPSFVHGVLSYFCRSSRRTPLVSNFGFFPCAPEALFTGRSPLTLHRTCSCGFGRITIADSPTYATSRLESLPVTATWTTWSIRIAGDRVACGGAQ